MLKYFYLTLYVYRSKIICENVCSKNYKNERIEDDTINISFFFYHTLNNLKQQITTHTEDDEDDNRALAIFSYKMIFKMFTKLSFLCHYYK